MNEMAGRYALKGCAEMRKRMYQFESRVRYSETDSQGRLTLEGVMEYFEDCSTFQSEDVGLGLQYLKENHRAWVLSFSQIGFNRYPQLGETIVIRTIPYDIRGFLGYRNFALETAAGETLAYANTLWTYLDTLLGRPVKTPEDMGDRYGLSERLPMEYAPRKIALPDGMQSFDEITVRPHHLDTNHHVNNVEYVRMARELIPDERPVRSMRVEYKQSALLGDVICPAGACDKEIGRTVFSLNDRDGKPYAVVELIR